LKFLYWNVMLIVSKQKLNVMEAAISDEERTLSEQWFLTKIRITRLRLQANTCRLISVSRRNLWENRKY